MECCENKNIIKKKEMFVYKLCYNSRIFLDRI